MAVTLGMFAFCSHIRICLLRPRSCLLDGHSRKLPSRKNCRIAYVENEKRMYHDALEDGSVSCQSRIAGTLSHVSKEERSPGGGPLTVRANGMLREIGPPSRTGLLGGSQLETSVVVLESPLDTSEVLERTACQVTTSTLARRSSSPERVVSCKAASWEGRARRHQPNF